MFDRWLTVVRGRNSAGKSTFFNTLLYSLGMEELVGGRDERVLPYGVRDYFIFNGDRHPVLASEVLLEIENREGTVVTLRRAIRHEQRRTKLIEVFLGDCLTGKSEFSAPTPTYVHDGGAAQRDEGFHRYLERFLGLTLPSVPTSSGGETKLYLQTIFAALAVEQKRGWTDYIATIPFYGIREARAKVVEYLLGLGVFGADALRNRLNAESVRIHESWVARVGELQRAANAEGFLVQGLAPRPDVLFEQNNIRLVKQEGEHETSLPDYRSKLRTEYRELNAAAETYHNSSSEKVVAELDSGGEELRELSFLHEQRTTSLALHRASLKEYEGLLAEALEDLARNATVKKLKQLGADMSLDLSADRCPTCHQTIADTLLGEAVSGPVMDLDENIAYLKSQRQMLERQIAGERDAIRQLESIVADLARKLAAKRDLLIALRGDISSGAVQSKAIVRRQVQIEAEVDRLAELERLQPQMLDALTALAKQLTLNQHERRSLSSERYSTDDQLKIDIFQKNFRANAGSFGYESADIAEIQISLDTLTPVLEQIELREISKRKDSDIKLDSSASDFVRLIWSYLLAVYQTSANDVVKGNHVGVLLFDEPGQHSMRAESQHALLQHLANEQGLQSIVAASFDENESVFLEATKDVSFTLIEWEQKLIQPF